MIDGYYTKAEVNNLLTGLTTGGDVSNVLTMYCTKTDTDTKLNLNLNSSVIDSYYTKSNIDNILTIMSGNHYTKTESNINYYYKSQVDALLGTKPNTEIVSQQINLKANIGNVYNKNEIVNFINPLAISANYYDRNF